MGSSGSVLIVDDQYGMRETLCEIFEASGYRVESAIDGTSALASIRANRFDAVVMDIRMPGMSGIEVMSESNAPPPPVILMTAYANEDELQVARSRAFGMVNKPFDVRQLLAMVADATQVAA